jgi:hypothetical protein
MYPSPSFTEADHKKYLDAAKVAYEEFNTGGVQRKAQ